MSVKSDQLLEDAKKSVRLITTSTELDDDTKEEILEGLQEYIDEQKKEIDDQGEEDEEDEEDDFDDDDFEDEI